MLTPLPGLGKAQDLAPHQASSHCQRQELALAWGHPSVPQLHVPSSKSSASHGSTGPALGVSGLLGVLGEVPTCTLPRGHGLWQQSLQLP